MEAVPELSPVNLENSPILREIMFTDTKTDSRGAEDFANDSVVRFLRVLVDSFEKRPKRLYRDLGLVNNL